MCRQCSQLTGGAGKCASGRRRSGGVTGVIAFLCSGGVTATTAHVGLIGHRSKVRTRGVARLPLAWHSVTRFMAA